MTFAGALLITILSLCAILFSPWFLVGLGALLVIALADGP
jgi:hypothetical protein